VNSGSAARNGNRPWAGSSLAPRTRVSRSRWQPLAVPITARAGSVASDSPAACARRSASAAAPACRARAPQHWPSRGCVHVVAQLRQQLRRRLLSVGVEHRGGATPEQGQGPPGVAGQRACRRRPGGLRGTFRACSSSSFANAAAAGAVRARRGGRATPGKSQHDAQTRADGAGSSAASRRRADWCVPRGRVRVKPITRRSGTPEGHTRSQVPQPRQRSRCAPASRPESTSPVARARAKAIRPRASRPSWGETR
jgi:hypothetical protein